MTGDLFDSRVTGNFFQPEFRESIVPLSPEGLVIICFIMYLSNVLYCQPMRLTVPELLAQRLDSEICLTLVFAFDQ